MLLLLACVLATPGSPEPIDGHRQDPPGCCTESSCDDGDSIWALIFSLSSSYASSASSTDHGDPPADPKRAAQSRFVDASLSDLRHDVAAGQGEYLVAYATLLGCPEAARPQLTSLLRQRYGFVFGGIQTGAVVVDRTHAVVRADPVLSQVCSAGG